MARTVNSRRTNLPRTVAVTGATGVVGQFVVERLIKEGVRVRAASSGRSTEARSNNNTETIGFDMTAPANVKSLLDGCDALVHCAFAHTPGRYRGGEGSDPHTFWAINLGATQTLLETCTATGVPRAIVMSSRAVFGTPATTTVSEHSSPEPDTHYGALKRAEESLVRISARQPEFDAACLRATGVYGVLANAPQSKWFAYCRQVKNDKAISEVRAGTEVHGEDLADAAWRLLTAPKDALGGRVFNCSDQWVSTRMLARLLNQLTAKDLSLPDTLNAETVKGVMVTKRLQQMGWQPGGTKKLITTLSQMLALTEKAQQAQQDLLPEN